MLYILYIVITILVLLLLTAFISKKEYTIVSEVVIDKEKELVYNYIIHLKNQEQYNKWIMADPNVELMYTGTDGTVGFICGWQSELREVGIGEQELTSIIPGEGYTSELRFKKPFEGVSHTKVITKALTPNQTNVTTTFNTRTEFPMNLMIPMIKNMLQKDLNLNAQNLKRVLEKK